MGGQHNYCGIWLDENYGHGHTSETCTTYSGYFQMSHNKQFKYRHLEVWGLGNPPVLEKSERATVLDGHDESKAILNLAGRRMHSEGLREPPNN